MWVKRIVILGVAALGAAAMIVAGPAAGPTNAAPCPPGQFIGCEPVPPAEAAPPAPVCDLAAAFRGDPACGGEGSVSGGIN
jgi:hypothetical protein